MKIFEFNSPEEMKDGAAAKQVNEDGNPIVTVDSVFGQGMEEETGETEEAGC